MEDLHLLPTTGPELGKVKCQLHKDLEHVNSDLFLDIQRWLKLRGKTCRPKLTDEQKAQLRTCFDLMDADGSGAIDAEELSEAFELLGMNYSRAEIQELLDDVDRDGSGECEYPEFVEIMTISLSRIREEQEKSGDKQGPDISFDLMATAYRRKRLMEGLMSGDRDAQNQILAMASSQLAAQDASSVDRTRQSNKGADLSGAGQLIGGRRLSASEHAVIRNLARKLPATHTAGDRTWQDLEKLARFGMAGIQKLRKPSVEKVLAQVLPHITKSPLPLPNKKQLMKIEQCLHPSSPNTNWTPGRLQNSALFKNSFIQPANYVLCKHKPKVQSKLSKTWSPGLTVQGGPAPGQMAAIQEERKHEMVTGQHPDRLS